MHEQVYAVRDERAVIEVVNLRARVTCPLSGGAVDAVTLEADAPPPSSRRVFFSGVGSVDAAIWRLEAMAVGSQVEGPAIVESSFTTIVVNPGARAQRAESGSLVIVPDTREPASARAGALEAQS